MRPLKILTLIFSLVLLQSCDPLRRIIVKNESTENATITFKLKGDSALHSPIFINSTDKVSYTVGNNARHNVMRLSLGTGNWTNGALKQFVDDLEYLEITSTSINEKLSTEKEIKAYLRQHLTGILRKNIHINIK